MPEPLARLALVNKRVVYDLLFHAAADDLAPGREQSEAPRWRHRRADGPPTWGQRLQHHPHVHCVVPAGGLSPMALGGSMRGRRFFLPIPVLRQVFRGKLVAGLREAFRQRSLVLSRAASQPLATDVGLPRVPAIALSSDVGGVREAALWQPEPCAALPRALHPPRRHLESPAGRRDRRHRRPFGGRTIDTGARSARSRSRPTNSYAGFSFTSSRSASSASATSASSRRAVVHASSLSVVRRSPSHQRHRTNRACLHATIVVAVPALRSAHAHRRAADRAAALSRSAPGRLP